MGFIYALRSEQEKTKHTSFDIDMYPEFWTHEKLN